MPDAPVLSVIVPVRYTQARADILDRLAFCIDDNQRPNNIEFLVVDDGSAGDKQKQLVQRCRELGLGYSETGANPNDPFNLSRIRNHGAQFARGQLVMFLDVDFMPYDGFYNDIITEAELLNMEKHINQFLMCPVIHLTEQGSLEHEKKKRSHRRQFAINAMLSADCTLMEKYSHGTSVIIINRHYYLSVGGHNESFEQWGYEDYEFTTRLMMKNPQFPLPEHWASMTGNFMSLYSYKGWKAAYRLHGDWLGNKGIYLCHIHHPVDKKFHANANKNHRLLKQQLKRGKSAKDPTPLAYPDAGRSLLLSDNPFCYSPTFSPFLGDIVFGNDDKLTNTTMLSAYLTANNISRIVFPNPYANNTLRALYDWCRDNNFPMIIAERGALPDSIYHDKSGFLTDSDSYAREKWDKPLTPTQEQQVCDYIAAIRHGSQMLEQQADRLKPSTVRKTLGINDTKKVVFVPFQQPNDTVIRHFSGATGSFENFHRVISELVSQLGDNWCVIYKKHPAENSLPPIKGAICADTFNTYDLIELADALVVINSGVGLYGAMFGKPVYVLGEAWYQHNGMNVQVTNAEQLPALIKAGFLVNRQTVERFIYYLRYVFYSFGKQHQRRIVNDDGYPVTVTSRICYDEVRNFGTDFIIDSSQPIAFCSPLFDRYRGSNLKSKNYTSNPSSAVRRVKLRKLKQKPIRFFVDAAKNLWCRKLN